MEFTHQGITCKIDTKLAESIMLYIDAIFNHNQDLVLVFDGAEGAGKSTLMRQAALFCSYYMQKKHNTIRPFTVDNIKFNLEDYLETALAVQHEKGHIHILDESRAVANRKRSTSKGNVDFTNYLSECRSSGHIHLIALPAYHDLDSYIAIWRCSFLVNIGKYFSVKEVNGVPVYSLVLGTYRVFLNDSKLKAMYFHKLRYIYPKKAVFTGKFTKDGIIPDEVYEAKKQKERAAKFANAEEADKNKTQSKKDMLLKYMESTPNHDQKVMCSIFNTTKRYINEVKQDDRDAKLLQSQK
jgi:hypothetical protein